MFLIWHAYQYIKAHRKIYLLFVLQLTLVVWSLNFSFSLVKSLDQLNMKYEYQSQLNTIYVDNLVNDERSFQNFTFSTLSKLQTEIPSLDFTVAKSSNLALYDGEELHEYNYYEVAGNFGEVAISDYSKKEINNQIFVPQSFLIQLKQTLDKFPNYLLDQGFEIVGVSVKDSTITLLSGDVVEVELSEVLSTNPDATVLFNQSASLNSLEKNIKPLLNTVIIPAKFKIYKVEEVIRSLGFSPSELSDEALNQTVHFLEENVLGYQFSSHSIRQELSRKEQEVIGISRAIFALSMIVLLIISVGLIGFIATLVDRRKHNISLSLVMGATKILMLWELFFELLFVLLVSGVMGTITFYGYSMLSPKVFGLFFQPDWLLSILLIFGQILMAVALTIILGYKYTNFDPIEVLSEV